MTRTRRARVTRTTTLSGLNIKDWRQSNNGYYENPWSLTFKDRQITLSESHAWPKDRGVRDAGGDFDSIKLTYRNSVIPQKAFTAGPRYDILGNTSYVGNCIPNVSGHPSQFVVDSPDDNFYNSWVPFSGETGLAAKGSEFIARSIPTNSTMSASVSLAELYREGLPSMIGASFLRDKASFFRSLGSEYLSLEFGWKPIVSDLKAAAKAIITSDDVLKQLQRDSGRDVQRRRFSPTEKWSTGVTQTTVPAMSDLPGQFFSSGNTVTGVERFERTAWFSGCFTYHYDPGHMSEVEKIVKQARLLYGLELTPEVLWNLAPWSWLVDWVSNVGPVLHNLSAFQSDGLVMRYGYVMEYNSRRYERRNVRGDIPFGTSLPRDVSDTFSGQRKIRRRATPYGFGVDIGGFNTRQWAILAALGITRAPRTL